jgi:hypothetical protein
MAKSVVAFSLKEFDPSYTRVLVGGVDFRYNQLNNLGTLEMITGNAYFEFSEITDLGNLTTIGDDADFSYSPITDLGNLTTIGGGAYFKESQITDLGNLTTIEGNVNFSKSKVENLGNLTTIGGSAVFNESPIMDLGNLTTIGRNAYFNDSQITDLANLTTIGGRGIFLKSKVENLGNLQTIGGDAFFGDSPITDLGNLQSIRGNAYFQDSQITDLGNLTTIEGDAYFEDSEIMDLGNLQTIGGRAYFGDREDLKEKWEKRQNKYKKGGRTISQTPAPKKDQIKGSDKNKAGSSKDTESAKQIKFNEKTLNSIQNKVDEHNKQYPNKKITLESAKAVVRRGMGAYSQTYRPTISGGKPNSRVAWGLARLNAFIYKIINGKSKSGKYSQDNDLIEELGYKVQKYEIGGIFQGTPHDFDKYSTEYMGTGEGLQAFGWGLYFTNIKDIAKNYAKNEMLIQKEISRKSDNSAHLWIYTNISDNVVDKLGYLKIKLKEFEELKNEYKKDTWDDKIETYSTLIDIIQNYQGKIYSVTLFKGEKETDTDLLDWEKKPKKSQLDLIKKQLDKEGIIVSRDLGMGKDNRFKGEYLYKILQEEETSYTGGTKNNNLYTQLSAFLGGDKETSLFLLRAGIDGIKYKAGTLSGMEDEEGYNYVIFNADDVTIEGKEKYADGGELQNEEFENSALFFGGFFTGIQRQGIGKSIIYDIFKNNPKLENILLYTQQDAIGFWQKLGGEIIKEGNDINGVHRYFLKINKNSLTKSKNIKELGVSYKNIETKNSKIDKGEYAINYGRQKIGFFFVNDLGTIKTDPKNIILNSSDEEKYDDGGEINKNMKNEIIEILSKNARYGTKIFDLQEVGLEVIQSCIESNTYFGNAIKQANENYIMIPVKYDDKLWAIDKKVEYVYYAKPNQNTKIRVEYKYDMQDYPTPVLFDSETMNNEEFHDVNDYEEINVEEFDSEFLYRGINNNEMLSIIENGFIKSNASMNIGEQQENTTSFAQHISQASSYAVGFNAWFDEVTFAKPKYILKVKKEGVNYKPTIETDVENEVDVFGEIPIQQIESIYEIKLGECQMGMVEINVGYKNDFSEGSRFPMFKKVFVRKTDISTLINEIDSKNKIEKNREHLPNNFFSDGGLIAPNGKPSKLTPEQYELVRTPAFKQWFGDWENDPENASKVVDENGEPKVVWRGESKDFNKFDYKKLGSRLKTAWRKAGFYFAPTKSSAEQYMFFMGTRILKEFFLNIRNPYTLDSNEFYGVMDWGSLPNQRFKTNKSATDYANSQVEIIKSKNHDGFFVTILEDDNTVEIVAFEPNQIKLANGTNTTFDNNNPDIRYKMGEIGRASCRERV